MKRLTIHIIMLFLLVASSVFARDQWYVGPHAAFAFPSSHHAYGKAAGEGLGVKIIYKNTKLKYITPRLDILYLSYGEKRTTAAGGTSYYSMVVETRFESFQATLGTHIAKSKGAFRPYIAPMAGVFNYRSVSRLPEYYYYYGYPYVDERDVQWKLGGRIQGGILLDVGLGALIDFAFTFQQIFDVKAVKNDPTVRGTARDFMINIGVILALDD